MVIKFGFVTLCLLAVTCTAQNFYEIQPFDFSEPACKYIVAELIKTDNDYLGLTAYFPKLIAFAKKYNVDKLRYKRQLGLLSVVGGPGVKLMVKILEHRKTAQLFGHLKKVVRFIPECLYLFKGFRSYVKSNIYSKVIQDQVQTFFS
ncbi:uncharacterized protein LOC143195674 isoform X1 [Rhynchophorus ferrugineus]|uniref:uncharacterized protein LOC143195674 isoform X1 n=1 Tax=Rhynchophorus ferrugineus TaxID=354439 RepID=UPI003FCE766C